MKTITKTISTICCSAILAVSTFATELPTIKPQQVASISNVEVLDFSKDSSQVAVFQNQKLRLINIMKDGSTTEYSNVFSDNIEGVKYSPDGTKVAIIDGDTLRVLDTSGNEVASSEENSIQGFTLGWSPDSSVVNYVNYSTTEKYYMVKLSVDNNSTENTHMTDGYDCSIYYYYLSKYTPNHEFFICSDDYNSMSIYDVDTGDEYQSFSDRYTNLDIIDNKTMIIENRFYVKNDDDGEVDADGNPVAGDGYDYQLLVKDIDTGSSKSIISIDGTYNNEHDFVYIKNSPYVLVHQKYNNYLYQIYDLNEEKYVAKVDFGEVSVSGTSIFCSDDGKKLAFVGTLDQYVGYDAYIFDISAISSAENFKVAPVVSNINSTLKNRDTLNITFDVASE
jgi:hypothetical protein